MPPGTRLLAWGTVVACEVFTSSPSGVALADDSASNDDGTEESNGSIFRTVLIFYGVVTGIVLVIMLVCAAVPFLCHCYCCQREQESRASATDNAGTPNAVSSATTPAAGVNGDENSCHFKEVARVVCVTLFWPVVVLAALYTALVEVKTALQRCMTARRQRRHTGGGEVSSDGSAMDMPGPGSSGARDRTNTLGMATVRTDGFEVITPALTTANSTFLGNRGSSGV